jgi:serine/threonine protein kinase
MAEPAAGQRSPRIRRRTGAGAANETIPPRAPETAERQGSDSLGIARADLARRTREVLHRGRARNPDVLLVEAPDGRSVVVKDFAPRGALVRATVGRWLVARELRAYRALAGHPAVPRLLGRIDALSFAVEYRPGRRMSRRLAGTLAPGFVAKLADAVRAMHARGIAHLDLRHRSNVLVDARGDPVLVDFASAVRLPRCALLARAFERLDWRGVEKWRQRLEPASGATTGASDSSGARRGASRPT